MREAVRQAHLRQNDSMVLFLKWLEETSCFDLANNPAMSRDMMIGKRDTVPSRHTSTPMFCLWPSSFTSPPKHTPLVASIPAYILPHHISLVTAPMFPLQNTSALLNNTASWVRAVTYLSLARRNDHTRFPISLPISFSPVHTNTENTIRAALILTMIG